VYLNLYYRHLDKFNRIKTVFTIHNIAYQGKYGTDILEDTCGIGRRDQHIVEYDGCANFMKGAFETADKITTVSPTYAQEILDPWFSYGLDALLREKQYKLSGILNGIDMEANNPATDPKIPFNYDVTNVEEGKAKCKEALQDKFGLHKDGSPVFAMVSRMVGMKGFDLVQSIADGLVDRGIELVILGSGENQYETFFSDLCARHPGRVGTYIGFEPALSQEIYAGADVFIMPSKSEPCGLAQMVACRYGTPPIVRETGGLRDSIHDCTLGEGNGFTFAGYSAHGGKRQTYENDLPEVCGLVVQALVALGREVPAEIAFHVVLDEVVPVLFVVVAILCTAAGIVQLMGAVTGKGKAVALLPPGSQEPGGFFCGLLHKFYKNHPQKAARHLCTSDRTVLQ